MLTAAHCLGGDIEVIIGSDNVNQGQKINVKSAIEHPDYNDGTDEYDIALLVLEEPTSLDIALVKVNKDNNYPAAGRTAHTMGWGDTDPGDSQRLSDELMVVDVEVISNDECEAAERGGDAYDGWIKDSMVCTFTNGQDACQVSLIYYAICIRLMYECSIPLSHPKSYTQYNIKQGDSGGPLVIQSNDNPEDDVLFGIVR